MPNRTLRGFTRCTSNQAERRGAERGREHFLITDQAGGVRVMHAYFEIDDSPNVVRDEMLALGPQGHRLDAVVRVTGGNRFEGGGFFRLTERMAEDKVFNRSASRSSQRIELAEPLCALGVHPICGHALMLHSYGLSQGARRRFFPNLMQTSPDHSRATGPALYALGFGLELVGRVTVTVAAGRFDALHFRFTDTAGQLPQEHPPYDMWCTADGDYLYLKGRAGRYMPTRYELVEIDGLVAHALTTAGAAGVPA